MPSTHSSVVAFMTTYIVLVCVGRVPLPRTLQDEGSFSTEDDANIRRVGTVLSVGWAGLVMGSRVYLGHHTIAQVVGGVCFGSVFAAGCFWVYYGGGGVDVIGGMGEELFTRWTGL